LPWLVIEDVIDAAGGRVVADGDLQVFDHHHA
jgi:hypothetical protein